MPSERHEAWVRRAIALAREAREAGNHPFGALLVIDDAVAAEAMNSVHTDHDPTAHAETNLVAAALRHLSPDQLTRAVHAGFWTAPPPAAKP